MYVSANPRVMATQTSSFLGGALSWRPAATAAAPTSRPLCLLIPRALNRVGCARLLERRFLVTSTRCTGQRWLPALAARLCWRGRLHRLQLQLAVAPVVPNRALDPRGARAATVRAIRRSLPFRLRLWLRLRLRLRLPVADGPLFKGGLLDVRHM